MYGIYCLNSTLNSSFAAETFPGTRCLEASRLSSLMKSGNIDGVSILEHLCNASPRYVRTVYRTNFPRQDNKADQKGH